MGGARADGGRGLRRAVPRGSHAAWTPGRERAPLAVLEATNRRRVPELVAIRKARMRASPVAFLRGAPAVRTYREQLARFAATRALEVWYSRVDGPPSRPCPGAGAGGR